MQGQYVKFGIDVLLSTPLPFVFLQLSPKKLNKKATFVR